MKIASLSFRTFCLIILALNLAACSKVEDSSLYPAFDQTKVAPPPIKKSTGYEDSRQVFFGDLHVHSALSYDAYVMGTRAMPDDAYTFMRGGTIEHGLGYPIRLHRPLDFGAVTDHAEYLNGPRSLDDSDPDENTLRETMVSGNPLRITSNLVWTAFTKISSKKKREAVFNLPGMREASLEGWQVIIDAAEKHNQPGVFTTFIAYEWSSMPNDENLHRNVIYKGSLVPAFPFSSLDSENPEDLWSALEQQREQGMESIAIPHNSNASNGKMFDRVSFSGQPLSEQYAVRRMANEPICEILQIKGTSETHPVLSVDDEFANYEIFDQILSAAGGYSEPKGSYVRDALRTGLEFSKTQGFNPYRFGVIGSTDSHNASSPVEEDNYHGKLPLINGSAGLRTGEVVWLPEDRKNFIKKYCAQGLSAVWAEENTRESLFDAMRRKETYATSGPRMMVRFFAGWDYKNQLLTAPDIWTTAYHAGVPMGGTLHNQRQSKSPKFLISALKDPEGANLDRVQIIKGWVDSEGVSHEKIFDVAASGDRRPDSLTGKLAPVGNTVDLNTASYTNTIGAVQLATLWLDPEFNPGQEAFYYARVLEIPTPRFTTYDAVLLGVAPTAPATIQERAITSAIWYRP